MGATALITVTTWTGWEATALRKAMRMSATDFAEHLGAGRRTVISWSARGREVKLSAELQAALDTVLQRASSEVVQRFEELCTETPAAVSDFAGSSVLVDTCADDHADQGGDVLRRDVLKHSAASVAGGLTAAPLVRVLLSCGNVTQGHAPAMSSHLASAIAEVKDSYQACRYEYVLDRLVALLPAVGSACVIADAEQRAELSVLATDVYHVTGSVLLKLGDQAMALIAAERSAQSAFASGDPIALGTSARIMTHALMSNGHTARAIDFAQTSAQRLDDATHLLSPDSVAVYGALVLRAAIAAARVDDRDTAVTLLDEADRAAGRLGHDGNDRWTGFGPTNVLQHRVTVALALGDAGTAVAHARRVPLDKISLAERKACLFVDVAKAYTQWGRREQALTALQAAYRIAPEEIRSRPSAHRIVEELAALARGHLRTQVATFASTVGVRL
jgi:tetratricopeptide (TPR) repeat protein/DNA-binding transcriptional regulator YiaG